MKRLKNFAAIITLLCFLTSLWASSGLVFAATKNSSNTNNSVSTASSNSSPIAQSFNANSDVYPGMLVSADPKNPGYVIPLTTKTIEKLIGVVVPVNNAQFTLTPTTGGIQQVLVADTGRYNALVISAGGNIATGDSLTMSSIPGIAMKAGPSDKTSVGQAEANFTGKTGVISQVKLKNSNGSQSNYEIGNILINVQLGTNNQYIPSNSGLPQFIIQAVYAITKKPVSPAKIYLGFIIIFAVILVVSTMFYSGTRNGIISIGRNPLSRKSIAKGLIQTIIAGLFVFGVGLGFVYAILIL